MIAKMIGARRIFELGSGFGYSTYWLARAVKENGGGVVHHTVWDEELSARAREHLTRLRMNNLVKFHIGEAIETLRGIDEEFDLLFCDIDKHAYAEALTEMNRHLRVGGVVIFDNMLLHGSVLPARRDSHVPPPHPSRNIDAAQHKEHHAGNLRGVLKTTNMLFKKANWTASLIPLRDGLAMAMKSGN
jgi:predicted O-methyltransferase YrrM